MGLLVPLLVNIGIYVAMSLIRRYLAEQPDGPHPSEIQLPTADQRSRIPLAYGRVLVRKPVILSHGDFGVREHEFAEQMIQEWFASIHYGLFANNVIISDDQNNYPQFVGVWMNEKPLANMTDDHTDFYNAAAEWGPYAGGPYAWGIAGSPVWSSYIHGVAIFTRGTPTETASLAHPTTQMQLYYNRVTSQSINDGSNIVKYRGWATCLLTNLPWLENDSFNRHGFGFGPSPHIPRVAFEAINPVAIPGVNQSLMEINGGDANPAGVLYDLLVNKENGRLGYAASTIDTNSFGQAALKLWVEGNGFSRVYDSETEVKNIITEIEQQMDGVVYKDPETGLWKIKLTREDYDVPSLPHLTEVSVPGLRASIGKNGVVSCETVGWDILANRVQVSFTARQMVVQVLGAEVPVLAYRTQVAEATAQASAAESGSIEPIERQYPGCSNERLASRLLSRDIRALTVPLTRVTMRVSRKAYFYYRGMVLKATSARWNNEVLVFRILEMDIGEYESNWITLELVQDRWDVQYDLPDSTPYPPEIGPVDVSPTDPQETVIEEAPWFWTNLAADLGAVSDRQRQRLWYLSGAVGVNVGYIGGVREVGTSLTEDDTGNVNNLPSFEVETAYSRALDPYDTTTGLRIKNLVGWTPASASAADIRTHGLNTIYVAGEILTFETATSLGGGIWRLNNVGRGNAGTAPVSHAVDELGYALGVSQVVRALGRRGLLVDDGVTAALSGRSSTGRSPFTLETDITARRRTLLPGTVADLNLGSLLVWGFPQSNGKTEVDYLTEGLSVSYRARDREDVELVRGDATAQAQPDTGTTFDLVVVWSDGTVNEAAAGETSLTTFGPKSLVRWGWGLWQVGVRSTYDLDLGGETVAMESWQIPTLSVRAWEFRNTLDNHTFFGASTTGWTVASGNIVATGSGPTYLSSYVTNSGSGTTNDWSKTIDVEHWHAGRMQAVLDFYDKLLTDIASNDTVQVDLYTLNAALTVLDTQTYGPSIPGATWGHQVLTISSMNVNTRYVKVRVRQSSFGELDETLSAVISGFCLRLGQITAQLLLNPGFETGLTSWTTSVGGYTDETTNAKVGTHRIQGQANAVNTVYQDVSITAGWDVGARAVAEASMYHPGPGAGAGTGTVTVQAYAGATMVASGTASYLSVDGAHVPILAHCDIPAGTTAIRTLLTGTRTAVSGNNQLSWDDCSLRIHKRLDPLFEREHVVRPVPQDRPTNSADWLVMFPDTPLPRKGMFTPGGYGMGAEPLIELRASTLKCKMNGFLTSDDQKSVSAWQFINGETSGLTVRSPIHGNWLGDEAFSVRIVFDLRGPVDGPRTLISRYDGNRGWKVGIQADGDFEAVLYGSGAIITAAVTGHGTATEGVNYLVMTYDPVGAALKLYTRGTSQTVSTAGVGEIRPDDPLYLHVGWDPNEDASFTPDAVVPSFELWDVCLTSLEVTSMWTHGGTEFNPGSMTEGGVVDVNSSVAMVVGSDLRGAMVAYYGYGQVPHGVDANDVWGMAVARPRENLVEPCVAKIADWAIGAGTTVAVRPDRGPDASWDTVSITGGSGHYREYTFPLNPANGRCVAVFFAKMDSAASGRFQLLETDGTLIDTEDKVLTTLWQRVDVLFTGWVGGTVNAKIRFVPSTSGTVRTLTISGPFFADQDGNFDHPVAIPVRGQTSVRYSFEGLALPVQFNHEGEIEVDFSARTTAQGSGNLVMVSNTGTSNDKRDIYFDGSNCILDHYNGSGTLSASTVGDDWSDDQNLRARWCRAGLLDAASVFAGIRVNSDTDYGRVAIWTAGTAELDNIDIGHTGGTPGTECEVLVKKVTLRGREKIL